MQITIKDIKKLVQPKQAVRPMGRQKGSHLKPMDMEQFIIDHNAIDILVDHPWISSVKLYENIFLRDTLAKTSTARSIDTGKWSVELSSKLLNGDVATQKEVFIKALCNLVSLRMFSYGGSGHAFQLLVDRYLYKAKKPAIIDLPKIAVN